jgi:hypothetical protein
LAYFGLLLAFVVFLAAARDVRRGQAGYQFGHVWRRDKEPRSFWFYVCAQIIGCLVITFGAVVTIMRGN